MSWADTDYPMLAVEPQPSAPLLPAVQKVREAAPPRTTDGTSNTIFIGEAAVTPAAPTADARYFAGLVSRLSAGDVD